MTAPLGGVDLVPTLLDLAGVPLPARLQGRSFARAITTGTDPGPAPVFAEVASAEAIYGGDRDPAQLAAHVMVLADGWKYVWNRFEIDELYDLEADPAEMHNRADAPSCTRRVADMRRLILAMLERTGPGSFAWCTDNLTDSAGSRCRPVGPAAAPRAADSGRRTGVSRGQRRSGG